MVSNKFQNQLGLSLPEMIIGSAIMTVIALGGIQAYQHFSSSTVKEIKKMDQISDFSSISKDLSSFSEGGGLSTLYLNLPVKISGCNDTEPCVKQLIGENFVLPTNLPAYLSQNDCIQFFRDAKAKAQSKLAYPSTPYIDTVWAPKDLELGMNEDLHNTWTLVDETSPPLMMMSTYDANYFLKIVKGQLSVTIDSVLASNRQNLYTFTEIDSNLESGLITGLKNHPFLIYSSMNPGIFTIKYAEDIIYCDTNRARCITEMNKYTTNNYFNNRSDNFINNSVNADFPNKVFAIKFSSIDLNSPYFTEISNRQNLPTDCKMLWKNNGQTQNGHFFPTELLSLSTDPINDPDNQLNKMHPFNPAFLSKYAVSKEFPDDAPFIALPLKIVTYKAEASSKPGVKQVVAERWQQGNITKIIKIHHLKGPLIFARKLGSETISIMYNPLKN